MPPKRKKKDAERKSEPAATKKKSSDSDETCPLTTLLNNIQLLSLNKTSCTELLQAFSNNKCGVLEKKTLTDEHADCYWILLTTHMIQRMVQHLEKQTCQQVAVVLSALCHALAKALYADKSNLERSAHNVARTALGRAIISVTIGSVVALKHLGGSISSPIIRRGVWSAMVSLDMVVNHASIKITATGDGWNHALFWLLEDAAHLDVQHEEELVAVCESASRALRLSKEEEACIASLTEKDAPTAASSATAGKRRRHKDESQSTLSTQFQSLIDMDTVIDGRVSIRRWASMTFVWFCQGQEGILEICNSMLSDTEYWTSVLDCPAVIGPKAEPATKERSPRKKTPGEIKTSPPVHIPGNVAMVALVARLLNIAAESGNNCGSRAPTGGMDTYAALVLGLTSGKGRSRSAAESLSSYTRPDSRNLASLVIYRLLQAHHSCLRTNCTSANKEALGWVLVNDESDGFAAAVPNTVSRPLVARFYPSMHRTLNSVIRMAASIPAFSMNDSTKRLGAIAAAFVLASGAYGEEHIVDAKLYGFAVGQLSSSLGAIVGADEQGGAAPMEIDEQGSQEERHARLVEERGLDQPVPIPSLSPPVPEKATRKKKTTKKSESIQDASVCTFGGIFPVKGVNEAQNLSDEDFVTLLIRGVVSRKDDVPGAAMFSELIKIVRCCYNLREPQFEAIVAETVQYEDSKSSGKKRAASSKATQGKKKRTKLISGESAVSDNADKTTDEMAPRSIKSSRAGLATDALNILRMLIQQMPATTSATLASRELRNYLRESLRTDHICSVVDLNRMITDALIESHLASKVQTKASGSSATSAFFSEHSGDYRHFERLLWTAHINLCQTIGRGEPSYDPRRKVSRPILGDAERRLAVFRAVAEASTRTTLTTEDKSSTPERWPLCLPEAQHALVLPNLISEPIPAEADSSPERFIADSFVSSIADALRNPSMLTHSEWYKSSAKVYEDEAVVAHDDFPLALKDARLLVLAVSRLPRKQQLDFLNKFVGTVSSAIEIMRCNEFSNGLVRDDADVSGFLARVVTVCSTLATFVRVGPQLREVLAPQIGPTQYSIPSLAPREEMTPKSRQEDGDWYRREASFVGLFSDWESPIIPEVNGPLQVNTFVDETVSDLRSLHESAVRLGFLSAKSDRGHLLFASWNASGRSASWEKSPLTISRSEISTVSEESSTRLLLEIRDDICLLNQEMLAEDASLPQSILTRLLQQREGGRRTSVPLKGRLETMMSKAEGLIDSIVNLAETEELPSASFALLEALSAYVAFIMSAHTKSIDNFLSPKGAATRRGPVDDGAPSDEGSTGSDAEMKEDERIGALMELSDAVLLYGAAPTHPDWLDVSCYLRNGITAADATGMAHRAMTCLQRLCSTAHAAHIRSMLQSLSFWVGDDPNGKIRAALALRLSALQPDEAHDTPRSSDDDAQNTGEEWTDAIASLCGVDKRVVKLFSEEHIFWTNTSHANEAFGPNSAQRILGGLHGQNASIEEWEPSLAEYRACGEWELLLSESLLGSCMNVDFGIVNECLPSESSAEPAWKRAYVLAEHWARVQEACVSHLMPATALLRFGMSGALGRKRHPLANHDLSAESGDLRFHEPLPSSATRLPDGPVSDAIMRTLATLARMAASTQRLEQLKRPCAAVASNLMIDSKSFSELEAMEALRFAFANMFQIHDLLAKRDGPSDANGASVSYLSERLIGFVEKSGAVSESNDGASPRLTRLLCFLGGEFRLSFDTIAKNGLDYTAILSSSTWQNCSDTQLDGWDLQQIHDRAITEMIGMILCDESNVTVLTWSRVSHILCNLLELEHEYAPTPDQHKETTSLLQRIIKALNGQGYSHLRTLVKWVICHPPVNPRPDDKVLEKISVSLCTFLSYVVGATGCDLQGGRVVVDSLLESLDQWSCETSQVGDHIMALLCLLGVRYNALHSIGSRLVAKMKTTESDENEFMGPVERFFGFVWDLERLLSESLDVDTCGLSRVNSNTGNEIMSARESTSDAEAATNRGDSPKQGLSQEIATTGDSAPRACSFVLKSGFHAQHWYNCYTCGLVCDKGCCSLCALLCHQGHDVAYSRHSSFFCDCGGEAPTDEENRVPCKCLTPIESRDAEKLFEGEEWALLNRKPDESDCVSSDADMSCTHRDDSKLYMSATRVASSRLERFARSSLDKLRTEAVHGAWTSSLFELLRARRQLWSLKDKEPSHTDVANTSAEPPPVTSVVERSFDRSLVPSLHGRIGTTSNLELLRQQALIPIRSFRASSFQLGLSNDSTTDRVKRAMISKNGIVRRALVADCRGRMIVAEPSSLLFCAILPSVNVRYEEKSSEVPCGRGQMSILGSSSIKFNIVGMELCRENERRLAVWGTSQACVVILSKECDKVERTIELTFELEPDECEVDYLVKCAWIPGSQTILLVACGPFVKLFDLRLAEEDKANSLASYSLAYEAVLRDVALAPIPSTELDISTTSPATPTADKVKLFVLVDIGHLLTIDLNFDESGQLKEQGDMYIESGEGISFPIGGVRMNHSTQIVSADTRTRTLGEGSSLVFLPKSGVLLYSCVSSSVVALLLDSTGNITGNFELLPNLVKGEVLGTTYDVKAPFTHWTELGVIDVDGAKFFRAICVGRSSRTTSQPKMLCLDYNEDTVRVKEVTWSVEGSIGLGPSLSLTSSFDGIAAFSAPTIANDVDAIGRVTRSDFVERACFCVVASNGSMLIFGEEVIAARPKGSTDGLLSTSSVPDKPSERSGPSFPLTVFEQLVNVSDADELTFGGDRIGSEPTAVKAKLSSKNSTYFMCPSRDGCTITLKLQKAYEHLGTTSPPFDKNEESASHDILGKEHAFPVLCDLMQHELVIVALRLLVGSTTTEFIPKYVSVEGRRVWLRPDVKKWYDLPLTADEIAFGLRNGFVSIGIGPSFDSGNNPLVDAIEVYAAGRGQISHWLPLTTLTSQNLPQADKGTSRGTVETQTPSRDNKLASFVLTLTHLLNVLGTNSDVTPEAQRIIRELIEATALDDDGKTRQSLTSLLSCIEPDPDERQKILDGGTLMESSRALNSAKDMLQELCSRAEGEGSRGTQGDHQAILRDGWIRVRRTTKECLKASAAITRKRPGNYKVAIQDIMTRENATPSIAAVAGDIFAEGLRNELECLELVPDLIELLLTESMLSISETGKSSSSFATFDALSRLLKSSNDDIVTACCESVLSYWTEHLSKKSDIILQYQCDSCLLCPIQGKRYTLLEGGSSSERDSDIDLCSDCYQIGKGFATSNSGDTKVRISGRTVGKTPKLSCARLAQMKPVAILTAPANTSDIATPASVSQNVSTAETAPPGASDVLEKLSALLFNDLLQLLADNLKEGKLDFSPSAFRSLVDLVLNITKKSGDEDLEMKRAKQFAEALSERIPHLIGIIARHDTLEAAARPLLTTCIQGLSNLVTPRADASGKSSLSTIDDCSVEDALPAKSKKKTDPRFVCEVHGVAAVRRRCSHGANKNRRFYVCGMARNSRCKYFKWADESEDGKLPASSEDEKSKWTTEIERFTWELFKEPRGADSRPLHVQLCSLLELDAHDRDTGALSLPVEATGSEGQSTRASETEKASSLLSSRYDEHAAASDYVDGVFCSQEKLRAFTGQWLLEDYCVVEYSIANQGEITIIKATLDLLSNIAGMAMVEGYNQHDNNGRPGWFSLLCEIVSSSQSSHYRVLAKRVLKRLCGGNKAIYHCVRDHYVFRLHFQKLLLEAHSPLLTALNIKEQARQCGRHWRTGRKVDFDSLPAGGLIGTSDLVSEDCVTVARSNKIGAALDELLSVAKNRCMNWRNFCSLTTLPQSRRTQRAAEQDNASVDDGLAGFVEDPNLVSAPPIISLIWIACTLCGENQMKVLELIDIAMSTSGGATTPSCKDTVPVNPQSIDPHNSDGGMDVDAKESGTFVPGSHAGGILPSTVLLKGEKALLVDEVHAFVVQFVLEGKSPGLRKVGGEVVFKICQNLQVEELERLFVELTQRALYEVAELGSTCNELFQLLQSLASSKIRTSSPQLIDVSRKVLDAFTTQMRSLRNSKGGLGVGSSAQKDVDTEKLIMERFDFTNCVNCHREQAVSSKGKPAASSRQSEPDSRGLSRTRTMSGASSSSTNGNTAAWLPEQVRPFARDSLEASTDASLSSEFSTYIQLKSRLAVSDIHLTIGDPRGRYVKTIAVYFSPRPVSDVNLLKSEEYSDIWQRCATLSLSRGATRVSCSLTEPIIAANLRVEYIEFYERPGGSRADDGSLLLHCPRCTRVVNNAHGVCGHCGEVAFQCRKCRHINYDRLDAFLCVECGYCSAGTFTYELTSGAASNAVAIVDDESYERTIKVLRVATKLHGEVRDALKERVRPVIGKRSLSVQKYGPALKRAFLGELPKISREKSDEGISSRMLRSSAAGSSASRGRDDSNTLAAANRARSLLHLARQLRSDSSSERSRDGDFLIRQALLSSAGRGLSLEAIDDVDSDMIGFINASNLGGPDPLSRLVASIQGRVRTSTGRDLGSDRHARPSENNIPEACTGDTCTKASSEERNRLYQLMRESERECFELQRRINAWKRLENDALADLGTESVHASFSQSQCSICSGTVTLQLLILFVELFGSDPARVQSIITEKSILALFDEIPDMDKDLFDAKRMAIVTLGTKSEPASKLILEVLRTRLKASRDAASAEILGKIIAIESTLSDDFVKLAAEILESGY